MRLVSADVEDDLDNLILDDGVLADFTSFCWSSSAVVLIDWAACLISFIVSRRNMLLVDFRATVDTRVGVADGNTAPLETTSIASVLSEEIALPWPSETTLTLNPMNCVINRSIFWFIQLSLDIVDELGCVILAWIQFQLIISNDFYHILNPLFNSSRNF